MAPATAGAVSFSVSSFSGFTASGSNPDGRHGRSKLSRICCGLSASSVFDGSSSCRGRASTTHSAEPRPSKFRTIHTSPRGRSSAPNR
jgi:hypothetical protein